jgi:hypothetical protein
MRYRTFASCFSLGRRGWAKEGSQPIGQNMAESKQSSRSFPVNNPAPANQDQPHHYCGSLLIIISVAEFEHSSLCYHSSLSASAFAFCAVRLIFEGSQTSRASRHLLRVCESRPKTLRPVKSARPARRPSTTCVRHRCCLLRVLAIRRRLSQRYNLARTP